MTTVQIHAHQLTSRAMDDAMDEWRATNDLLPDAAVVTVAAWWQSSGTPGRELAALASHCRVDAEALIDDVNATIEHDHPSAADVQMLHAVRDWAEDKLTD